MIETCLIWAARMILWPKFNTLGQLEVQLSGLFQKTEKRKKKKKEEVVPPSVDFRFGNCRLKSVIRRNRGGFPTRLGARNFWGEDHDRVKGPGLAHA